MNYKKGHAIYPPELPGAGASGQGGRKADGLYACGGDLVSYQAGKNQRLIAVFH